MCRIFLAQNLSSLEELRALLIKFIETTMIELADPAVAVRRPRPKMVGFGISWYNRRAAAWNTRKTARPTYEKMRELVEIICRAAAGAGAPQPPPVLAHIRIIGEETEQIAPSICKNTQPIVATIDGGTHVLLHNGSIFKFAQHRATLMREVAPQYHKYIRGKTDTEVLLYFLLSIVLPPRARRGVSFSVAFARLMDFLRKHNIAAQLNFIYGAPDGNTYYVRDSVIELEKKSLYETAAAGRGGALVVSTMKLLSSQRAIL